MIGAQAAGAVASSSRKLGGTGAALALSLSETGPEEGRSGGPALEGSPCLWVEPSKLTVKAELRWEGSSIVVEKLL